MKGFLISPTPSPPHYFTNEYFMYKEALRVKLRYETSKGQISVEDLFDLPLTAPVGKLSLNSLAKDIWSKLNSQQATSFVEDIEEDKGTKILQLQLDILKDVISTRKSEINAFNHQQQNRVAAQRLMEAIENKKHKELEEKPLEQLEAELFALQKLGG